MIRKRAQCQPKPNLKRKRKALENWLEGLLEIVGLEVTAEGVRAGTHSRIPDCRSCNAQKQRAPNKVRIFGVESKLVFDNIRE